MTKSATIPGQSGIPRAIKPPMQKYYESCTTLKKKRDSNIIIRALVRQTNGFFCICRAKRKKGEERK